MSGDTGRRLLLVGLAVAVLAGAGVADRVLTRPGPPPSPASLGSAVTTSASATSSAWFCAAAASAPAGSGASIILTNPRPRPVTGTMDVHSPGSAGSEGRGFAVPAAGQLSLPLATLGAARVLLDGGGVAALELVEGPAGLSAAPCASTTSAQWYFAHGSTASGHSLSLALFNPSSSDAVVDVTFVSAQNGAVAPPAYQGLPVPAGGVVVENVGDHVQNDPSFATEVVALSGTVVAGETDYVTNAGTTVVVGSTRPLRQWGFAYDVDTPGAANVFSVLNPSDRPAVVKVSVGLAQGQAAPLSLPVAPGSLVTLVAQDQTRIPAGVPYGLTFASSGPGIVVARETSLPPPSSPQASTIGVATGVPGGQRRWLLPPVPSPFVLGIVNVAGRRVHVTISGFGPTGALVPAPGATRLPLGPDGLILVGPEPGLPLGGAAVEVSADGPVAVELDQQVVGSPGTIVVPAWPLLPPGG